MIVKLKMLKTWLSFNLYQSISTQLNNRADIWFANWCCKFADMKLFRIFRILESYSNDHAWLVNTGRLKTGKIKGFPVCIIILLLNHKSMYYMNSGCSSSSDAHYSTAEPHQSGHPIPRGGRECHKVDRRPKLQERTGKTQNTSR